MTMTTQISHEPTTGMTVGSENYESYEERTGWVGWIYFASVMMIIAGTLNAIQGLVAIVNDEWVVWGNSANLYLDLTNWGWVHLIVGGVVLLAGFGVLTGNVIARGIAVLVASVSIVANFMFIPAYPVWALTIIALDAFVIFALTAHGRELR
jgi:hypothetical protein